MNAPKSSTRPQRWAHQRWARPVVLVYGALVAGTLIFALVTVTLADRSDPSFGLLVPMAATFPLGPMLVLGSTSVIDSLGAYEAYGNGVLALVLLALAGAAQAYGLWLILRGKRLGR